MKPTSPVLPGSKSVESRVGANQEQYLTLPSFQTEHTTISRWRLTEEERKYITEGGDLFIAQLNFGGRVQPILPLAAPEGDILGLVLACEEETIR